MTAFYHFNFNVLDLERSLAFYREALSLSPVREKEAGDGSALYAKHKAMGCVCFENPAMGVYFISDPDGYWIEIVPEDK